MKAILFLLIAALFALSFSPSAEASRTKRRLLSPRKHHTRNSEWSDEQNWSVSKFVKDAEKTVEKTAESAVDEMKSAIKSLGKEAKTFIDDASDAIDKALKGKFIKRTSNLFDDLTSDASTGWQDLVSGFDSIEDYFENQFIDDLKWIAEELVQLWDFVCDDAIVKTTVVTACSAGLSAVTCVALDGMAPFCGIGTLLESIVSSTVSALITTVVTCTVYYAIEDLPIDGWCDGIAYSTAALITDVWVSDPFTPACDAAVSCSCGTCPYTCDYPVSAACDLDTYESAVSELISELTSLLS